MSSFKEWPAVLQRRWLFSALAGAGFLLVGVVVCLTLQDRMILIISALLAAFTVFRCITFYQMAKTNAYEMVEGICIVVGRAGFKKQRSVRLMTLDGNEYSVMLDKRTPLRIGNHYRIYFRSDPAALDTPEFLRQYFARDQFLALEDLGEYKIEPESELSEVSGE